MDTFDTFRMMLDQHSSRILSLTEKQALNAAQLSDALDIPIAACYRRIRMLKNAGMLKEVDRVVSTGGKSVAVYRSVLESAEVVLKDGRLRITIKADGEDSVDSMDLSEESTMLYWATEGRDDKNSE